MNTHICKYTCVLLYIHVYIGLCYVIWDLNIDHSVINDYLGSSVL